MLTALEGIAARHDCPMGAVALAWLLTRPGVTAPLASARNLEQFAALLPMATITLLDGRAGRARRRLVLRRMLRP